MALVIIVAAPKLFQKLGIWNNEINNKCKILFVLKFDFSCCCCCCCCCCCWGSFLTLVPKHKQTNWRDRSVYCFIIQLISVEYFVVKDQKKDA
jgi:hypothetical protein